MLQSSTTGAGYTKTGKCALQVPNGVHFELAGRQYCALSVARTLLELQWGLGNTSTMNHAMSE